MKGVNGELLISLDQQWTYEKIMWNNDESISNPCGDIPCVRIVLDFTSYILYIPGARTKLKQEYIFEASTILMAVQFDAVLYDYNGS